MVNSIGKKPESLGGCCYFSNEKTVKKINFGTKGILGFEI
jgi:hypothetical protein